MVLSNLVRFFLIPFLALSNLTTSKAGEPLVLNDFGKLKGISETLHSQHNLPLSQDLKQEHNLLASEVNGFIDAIDVYVSQGKYPQESLDEVEQKIREINKKATLIYESSQNNREGDHVINKFGFKGSQFNRSIGKTTKWIDFENIRNLVEWVMNGREENLKKTFINKLNQRKWVPIS